MPSGTDALTLGLWDRVGRLPGTVMSTGRQTCVKPTVVSHIPGFTWCGIKSTLCEEWKAHLTN